MFGYFKKQKGSGLIGLLIVIVIIAALAYGGSFFWQKNTEKTKKDTNKTNVLDEYQQAQDDIDKINKTTDNRQQTIENILEGDKESDEHIIRINNIKPGDNLVSPVMIEGEGAAFENILIIELRNQDHKTMVKEFATIEAPEIGKSGLFKITLDFDFNLTKEGFVAVYEESVRDGSEVNLIEIPVKFASEIELHEGCIDSDGGKNHYKTGKVEILNSNEFVTDFCSEDKLFEFYCSDNKWEMENYICVDGCEDGACLK